MKKLIMFIAVVMTVVNLANAGQIIPIQDRDTAECLYFQFNYTTPYGVPKLDSEGNVVKDEKGSPVVVFKMRKLREHAVMRLRSDGDSGTCEFARLDENGNVVWDEQTPCTFATVEMEDGGILRLFCFEYTFIDRGIGVTPGKVKVWSSIRLNVNKETGAADYYTTQQTKIEKSTGRILYGAGGGDFGGFSIGQDGGQWTDETHLKSDHKLPIWGSCTFSNYGSGTMGNGSIRKILEKNIEKFSYYK